MVRAMMSRLGKLRGTSSRAIDKVAGTGQGEQLSFGFATRVKPGAPQMWGKTGSGEQALLFPDRGPGAIPSRPAPDRGPGAIPSRPAPASGPMADAVSEATSGALNAQGLGGMALMGLVGGGASAVTGGEFGQGAVMGMGVGYGARSLITTANVRGLGKSIQSNEKLMANGYAESFGNWASGATMSARAAAFSGAGLGGFFLGGSRQPSHARGFNQHRGNGF